MKPYEWRAGIKVWLKADSYATNPKAPEWHGRASGVGQWFLAGAEGFLKSTEATEDAGHGDVEFPSGLVARVPLHDLEPVE